MKTIVVPTDLSREADHAIDVALVFARHFNSEIHLVHVIQSIYDTAYADTADLPVQGRKKFEQDLQAAHVELADLAQRYKVADIPIKASVKVGSIFQDIADIIVNIEGDIIVLGTKGDKGMHEFFIGSNAEKVVRRAHCPVVTVRNQMKDFRLKKVVFATDFAPNSDQLLNKLLAWQGITSFDIDLLYVNTQLHFMTTAQINVRMHRFLKKHEDARLRTSIIDDYTELDGIHHYAAETGADMIAMLTHGREGVEHVLEGSLAEKLVNQAGIPILTYSLHH